MSRLTRDGRRPNLSRETKFSGANGDGEIFIFPVRPTTKHGCTRNSCADVVLRATGVLLNYFVTNNVALSAVSIMILFGSISDHNNNIRLIMIANRKLQTSIDPRNE